MSGFPNYVLHSDRILDGLVRSMHAFDRKISVAGCTYARTVSVRIKLQHSGAGAGECCVGSVKYHSKLTELR